MAEKKKVYVETSVISNLAARPSHNPIDAAARLLRRCGGVAQLKDLIFMSLA